METKNIVEEKVKATAKEIIDNRLYTMGFTNIISTILLVVTVLCIMLDIHFGFMISSVFTFMFALSGIIDYFIIKHTIKAYRKGSFK